MTDDELKKVLCDYGKANPEEVRLRQAGVPDDDPRMVEFFLERRRSLEDIGLLARLDPDPTSGW